MPIYDVKCSFCEHTEEVLVGVKEELPVVKCEVCKKGYLVKCSYSGGVAVRFRGSGFYETDYKYS